eukprot:CAMPEP_0194267212 /NCGR_PEP_ID=MMETSP0169-20130528/1812_1 /TAXON_ID=218684 /ORGANISM="Corethron pennatum, Strain L29A3" /LENGTH=256 /DNA_ID=CAMNT_0039008023 /DNA_START=31 /DNA_END=801 /DNA_ORIENTATION=+
MKHIYCELNVDRSHQTLLVLSPTASSLEHTMKILGDFFRTLPFRVIVLETNRHATSRRACCDHMLSLFELKNIDDAFLWAISTSGLGACEFALYNPERVTHFFLSAAGRSGPTGLTTEWKENIKQLLNDSQNVQNWMTNLSFFMPKHKITKKMAEFRRTHLGIPYVKICSMMNEEANGIPENMYANLKVDMTLLACEKDSLFHFNFQKLKEQHPQHATIATLPNADHSFHTKTFESTFLLAAKFFKSKFITPDSKL